MEQNKIEQTLSSLRGIQPRPEWAQALKARVLASREVAPRLTVSQVLFGSRLVLSGMAALFVGGVLVVSSQGALPGDPLFEIKKATEDVRVATLSPDDRLRAEIETLRQRLDSVEQVAGSERFASAVKEYQAQSTKVAQEVAYSATQSGKRELAQEVSLRTQALSKRASALETAFATKIDESQELEDATQIFLYKALAEDLFEDVKNAPASESQQERIAEGAALLEDGRYQEAFELFLIVGGELNEQNSLTGDSAPLQ